MAKLSKTQQEVVDKMRAGWVLHNTTALTKKGHLTKFISRATFNALTRMDVIELVPGFLSIYQLTKKYRTGTE